MSMPPLSDGEAAACNLYLRAEAEAAVGSWPRGKVNAASEPIVHRRMDTANDDELDLMVDK